MVTFCKLSVIRSSEFQLILRGADKSLARPGWKQATATKLYLLQVTQRKFRLLSVQPGLRSSNDLRVGQKNGELSFVFFQSGRAKDLSVPLYVIIVIMKANISGKLMPFLFVIKIMRIFFIC